MPSWILPDVQAALITLLDARAGLDGVQVSDGYSGVDEAEPETIFTNEARSTGVTPAGLKAGRTFYNEAAEFDVVVLVKDAHGTPAEVKARAQTLGREVAECVADNRTLGALSGLKFAVVDRWDLRTLYGQTGSIAELTFTIRYEARLT